MAKSGRRQAVLIAKDRECLERIMTGPHSLLKHVRRADIILRPGCSLTLPQTMRAAGISKPTVRRWRGRFLAGCVDSLLHAVRRRTGLRCRRRGFFSKLSRQRFRHAVFNSLDEHTATVEGCTEQRSANDAPARSAGEGSLKISRRSGKRTPVAAGNCITEKKQTTGAGFMAGIPSLLDCTIERHEYDNGRQERRVQPGRPARHAGRCVRGPMAMPQNGYAEEQI